MEQHETEVWDPAKTLMYSAIAQVGTNQAELEMLYDSVDHFLEEVEALADSDMNSEQQDVALVQLYEDMLIRNRSILGVARARQLEVLLEHPSALGIDGLEHRDPELPPGVQLEPVD